MISIVSLLFCFGLTVNTLEVSSPLGNKSTSIVEHSGNKRSEVILNNDTFDVSTMTLMSDLYEPNDSYSTATKINPDNFHTLNT